MSASAPSRRRRFWAWTCAGCLLVFVTMCVGAVALRVLLPGLRLNAEEAYSGAPDPAATAAVNRVLQDAGLDGVDAVVLPIKGRQGQIAIITMDEAAGFGGAGSDAGNAALFDQVVGGLAHANQAEDLRIERVSMIYDEGQGLAPITMTASQETLEAYSSGEIGQGELLSGVDIDISAIISYEQLMSLIEGGAE